MTATSDNQETTSASCGCGQLSASIAGDAQAMTIMCHCTDCQKRSGSPFGVMAYFSNDAVSLVGEAREYERATDSGGTYTTIFCPQCGSTILGKASIIPDIAGVPVGAMTDPQFPAASLSFYEQSKHDWVTLPDEMHHFARGRDS